MNPAAGARSFRFTRGTDLWLEASVKINRVVEAHRDEFASCADLWGRHGQEQSAPSTWFVVEEPDGAPLGLVGWVGLREEVTPFWWAFEKGRGVGTFAVAALVEALLAWRVRSRSAVALPSPAYEAATARLAEQFAARCKAAGIPQRG